MNPPRERWLQRELLWRLMPPVLVIVVFSSLLSAYSAQYLVDRVFDRWLLDAARSLAQQVRFADGRAQLELSAQAEALLTYDIVDSTFYEVAQEGRHLIGRPGLSAGGTNEHGYSGGARAYDGAVAGQPVRIAWVPVAGPGGARAEVAVGETLVKRQRARRDLLLTFIPEGLLVLAAALLIGVVVRHTLRPLEGMAAAWNERSHVSLEPIPTDDVPHELMPFALALNDLLARVRDLLDRERRFAADAAHQLRTPLTGLQLGLSRAAQAPDLAATRGVLRELEHSAQRAARVVQQLLALSRLDAQAGAGPGAADVDLATLARDVGESYLEAARHKGVEMELDCAAASVVVKGQPDLLSEALGNLIDNAIRYTPAGGRVVISVRQRPAAVRVADSGPGIADDERDAVFSRFVRGRGATGEGSGLGLAIVREIAALHRARVSIDRSDWGGATVALQFP